MRNQRGGGQSTLEYIMFIVIFIAALVTIQHFVKAALMGRWQTVVDAYGFGRQYEPGKTVVTGGP